MTEILNRCLDYKHADQAADRSAQENLTLEHKDGWTADDLTRMIQWHLDEHKLQQSDVTELCQLETQIENILEKVRIRKTQIKLDFLKSLQQEQKQLKQEKQLMVRKIKAAKENESNIDG